MPKNADAELQEVNKVVLIAKRDIQPGAELTYDYRCALSMAHAMYERLDCFSQ